MDLIGNLKIDCLISEAHKLEKLGLRHDLVLLGRAAGGDVIEILQLFEAEGEAVMARR